MCFTVQPLNLTRRTSTGISPCMQTLSQVRSVDAQTRQRRRLTAPRKNRQRIRSQSATKYASLYLHSDHLQASWHERISSLDLPGAAEDLHWGLRRCRRSNQLAHPPHQSKAAATCCKIGSEIRIICAAASASASHGASNPSMNNTTSNEPARNAGLMSSQLVDSPSCLRCAVLWLQPSQNETPRVLGQDSSWLQ